MPVVTKDATSGKWIPQSSSEMVALLSGTGIGTAAEIYLLQLGSGSDTGVIASGALTVVGTAPTYQSAVSGWTTKQILFADGVASKMGDGGSGTGSNSALAFAWANFPASFSSAQRSLLTLGSVFTTRVGMDSATSSNPAKVQQCEHGGAGQGGTSIVGTNSVASSVHPVLVQADQTAATATVQTDLETLSGASNALNMPGGATIIGGDNGTTWLAGNVGYLYLARWQAANAEITATQRNSLIDRFMNGPAYSSIAVTPGTATLALAATQALVATGTRVDTSTGVLTTVATWTTSNAAVATVNSSGVVTAVAGGTATITASFTSLNATPASNTCAITVSAGGSVYVPIPVIGTDVPDHVASALGRLFEQDKGKPTIAALVTAYVTPIQALESALWQLLTQRQVATAIGAQLDALGKLVNQPRNGSIDTDYSRYIRARISTNNSKGRFEDLITIARLVLNDTTLQIVISQEGAATIRMRIVGVITDSTAAILVSFMAAAVAAGIRLVVQWSVVATAAAFRFDAGPGWDVGKLAAAIG